MITLSAKDGGTEVNRKSKVTKIPVYLKPMVLVIAMVSPIFERKMKAELESAG